MNSKKIVYVVFAVASSIFMMSFLSRTTFAANPGCTPGYCQSTDDASGTGGNAHACGAGGCKGVINSRSTGWDSITVTQPNQVIHSPAISYGSIQIAAHDYTTGSAAVGSTYYMYSIYADRSGYITKDGVRTWVNQGEVVARIPVEGLKRADGTYDHAFAAQFKGYGYRKNGYGIPEAQVLAIYKQMVGAGKLQDILNNPDFTAFGGLDGMVEVLGEDGVSQILKQLCDAGYCDGTTPNAPSANVPLLSCHGGSHYGWAEGNVSVANLTTGDNAGFSAKGNTVWARPGDSVRFMTQYCWGVGAVGGSLGNASRPYAIFPGGAARAFGAPVNEVWFSLSASQNANYLFGRDERIISGGSNNKKNNLLNPHATNIGSTGVNFTDADVARTGNYAFTVLSPSEKGEDANKYACMIYDFAPFFTQFSYQIPGIATGSCPAIANNGGVMSDVSNSPGIISQTIRYNYATAWQMWRHNQTGGCYGCTHEPETPYKVSARLHADNGDRNALDEFNANVRANPFQSMQAATSAGVNDWGLINKHGGDTALHRYDCDHSGCGCRGWIYTCYGCCQDCDSQGVCVPSDCTKSCTGTGEGNCHCSGTNGKNYYMPVYDYSTGMQDLGERSSTASVNVPYSFRTSTQSTIQAPDRIYLGETVTSNFVVSILPRSNTNVHNGEPYATIVDGEIRAVEFVVDSNDNITNISGSSNSPQDPCGFYQGQLRVISGCNTIWSLSGGLNPQGRYSGWTYSESVKRVVPDMDRYPVGSRYCVAVGISHSDSHEQPDSDPVSGMSHFSNWRISGASCRTIAKKPNFQVWNGYFYTNGEIDTSLTRKHVGVDLGGSSDPTGLFGSWDEYYVIANKEIEGFSSGAGLGYYGKERNTSLGLMGGNSPNTDLCDLSKMTISNSNCIDSDVGSTGWASVYKNMDTILQRLYSRYTNPSATNGVTHLPNGAVYVNYNGNLRTSDIRNLSGANSPAITNTDFTSSFIRQTKSNINSESEQTTSNYASNTLVIYVTGKLTIDTNICTGSGNCSVGNNASSLTLQGRNSDYYTNIFSIPQIIIIAKGGIDITRSANQIDAWLITDGTVDTCVEFKRGSGSIDSCPNQLIVNGPVVATSLKLNRTAGANPGPGTNDRPNYGVSSVLHENIANDGSITPGEIFNLRPDTLYWAYGQSQRFSQANVTYTRELAPRY